MNKNLTDYELEVITKLTNMLAPSNRLELGTWFRENGLDLNATGLAGGIYYTINATVKNTVPTPANRDFLDILKKFLALGKKKSMATLEAIVEKYI